MTTGSAQILAMAFLVVVGTAMVCNLQGVSAQCQGSIPALASQCQKFVQKSGPKIPPSPECCSVVKVSDVPCLCKLITKEIENLISMEKVVYVARTCGVNLPAGMKCGSFTVPPSRG